jgi:hypothetical protein
MNAKSLPSYKDQVRKRRKALDEEHHDWRIHYRRLKANRMINGDVTFSRFLDRIAESLAKKDLDYFESKAKAQEILDNESRR